MMKINRDKLLNDLQHFVLRGNGVIIGGPGVGKTYLLKELRQHLKSVEIPHLLLRIDQLGDGTNKILREELLYEGDLIEKLKSVPVSDKKAILLFDAFDAARDERTRKNFLKLIQRSIHELHESWNIVVTARTYDAKKSQELLDLFGNLDEMDLIQYQNKEILCRHFTIPHLTEDEILQALDQIGCPQPIYDDGSQDFKNIVANPFNLWLLEKILRNLPDEDLITLSQIHSEVQLLDLFWHRRIETVNNETDLLFVLEGIASEMVKERSLSIRQNNIYEALHLDRPAMQTAWTTLLSDAILAKVSTSGQRIAFSHNILFDYAISVLLIDDEPQHLENFVLEDVSRPLFLLPSLTYFFTRLWHSDSIGFWQAFWHFSPNDQSVHLRLVGRLIPTNVIANETREFEQLNPIFDKYLNRKEVATEVIALLLQSLRMLQIERANLWSKVYDRISTNLHVSFASDLAILTSDILEQAIETEDLNLIDTCGEIGRRLLEWVWQEKETSENDWYNRLGGFWAVPLVARTYHTNIQESRALLKKVLQLIKEENFPIGFLTWLTEHVDKIWDHDPEFVTLIYCTVFFHDETSDVKTNLGNSHVLPMTSFRSQDYRMCQYRLVKHFPHFLQASPLEATQAVIRSLNIFIVGEHIVRYLKGGVVLKDMIETFNFREKPAYFLEDGSYIWDAQNSSDEPIEMADALFEYIAELAMSEDQHLDSLLDVFYDEVVVAFFWKRLLGTASQFPKIFAPRLFELCIAKPIVRGNDTRYELGQFLETAASEFNSDQLRRVEESILALPEEATDEDSRNVLVYRKNRLLERIPENLLITGEAKQTRKEMVRNNDIQENRPLVSFEPPTWSAYTEDEHLQRQGVDTTKSENQELQQFFKLLNEFSSDWMNGVPTVQAAELILPHLQKVYTVIKSNSEADKKIIDSLWHKLTACVAILGRIANNLDSDSFAFCRQVLLEAAKHEQPKFNPKYDTQFDFPGYSPFPRHEAAAGLLRLASHQSDEEMLDAIETLAGDRVPSVRMVTAMELSRVYNTNSERFWHIMENRAIYEPNHIVQEPLYAALIAVVRYQENEHKITQIMANLLQHTPLPSRVLGTSDPFISLLMGLAINRENSWALKTIEDTFLKDPIRFANLLTRAVSHVIENYVVPKHLETPDRLEIIKQAIAMVSEVITAVSGQIKGMSSIVKANESEEEVKKLHDTYKVIDEVIMRLYFAVAYKRGQSEEPIKEISDKLRCDYYNEVKPLMKQIITFAQDSENGIMFAPTAHYFMQLLASFLSCNPKEVVHLAVEVVRSSEPFGYNLDGLAVRDVVEFVEIVLADYRHEVRDDEECLEDLLNLLDMFAKTGWTDALKLIWRLDEVFR